MDDRIKEIQERCSGDASYRTWRYHPDTGEPHMMVSIEESTPNAALHQRRTPYTDAEGTAIYEGDILQWFADEGEDEEADRDYVHWGYLGWNAGGDLWQSALTKIDHCKVIGNVFENPELLGATDG